MNKLKYAVAVATSVLAAGVTTAVAYAAIPDANGQINACYHTRTKVLKVTETAGDCAAGEQPLSWAQAPGPSGEQAVAYGHAITETDPLTGTATLRLDTDRSHGVVSVTTANRRSYCIDLFPGLVATNVLFTKIPGGEIDTPFEVAVRGNSVEESGVVAARCADNADIVLEAGNEQSFYFRVY